MHNSPNLIIFSSFQYPCNTCRSPAGGVFKMISRIQLKHCINPLLRTKGGYFPRVLLHCFHIGVPGPAFSVAKG